MPFSITEFRYFCIDLFFVLQKSTKFHSKTLPIIPHFRYFRYSPFIDHNRLNSIDSFFFFKWPLDGQPFHFINCVRNWRKFYRLVHRSCKRIIIIIIIYNHLNWSKQEKKKNLFVFLVRKVLVFWEDFPCLRTCALRTSKWQKYYSNAKVCILGGSLLVFFSPRRKTFSFLSVGRQCKVDAFSFFHCKIPKITDDDFVSTNEAKNSQRRNTKSNVK